MDPTEHPAYAYDPAPAYAPALPLSPTGGGTTVIVNQISNAPSQPNLRPWSTGLMACCDDMVACMCACFCTPCALCRIASALNEGCCVPTCVNGGILAMRTKMRAENHIQGSIGDDSCILCCCGLCAICQMERELKYLNKM